MEFAVRGMRSQWSEKAHWSVSQAYYLIERIVGIRSFENVRKCSNSLKPSESVGRSELSALVTSGYDRIKQREFTECHSAFLDNNIQQHLWRKFFMEVCRNNIRFHLLKGSHSMTQITRSLSKWWSAITSVLLVSVEQRSSIINWMIKDAQWPMVINNWVRGQEDISIRYSLELC